MASRVLVTGATGFIGRHALSSLLARGYEVHAVTSRQPVPDNPAGVQWHHLSLLDREGMSLLMARIQPCSLLHLAWYAAPADYWTSVENIRWVQISLDLIREFARHGGRRVVVAGTCAEYDWRYGCCSEALTPLAPASLYGVCKHALQLMVSAMAKPLNISVGWGRIFFLYGPYEHPQRLVASVIRSLLKEQVARCTHGKQIRDFSHVEDIAAALAALLDSAVEGPVNIASGNPVAVRDVILAIGRVIQRPDLINLGALPARADDPWLVLGDIHRLTHEVGWSPKYDIHTGITQTAEWWQQYLGKDNDDIEP